MALLEPSSEMKLTLSSKCAGRFPAFQTLSRDCDGFVIEMAGVLEFLSRVFIFTVMIADNFCLSGPTVVSVGLHIQVCMCLGYQRDMKFLHFWKPNTCSHASGLGLSIMTNFPVRNRGVASDSLICFLISEYLRLVSFIVHAIQLVKE